MDSRSRWFTVGLALAAATSFAIAVQTAWWGIAEVAIGPFGSRHCFGGECREAGLAWTGGSELWMRSAVATRAAGYIAMFVLIMFAGAIAAKREPKIVARGCLAAIVTAIATGAYFYVGYPGVGGASVAAGFLFYVGAIVAGVAAIVLFLRRARR
ncbi:MAG TPA: hypothetical protein VFV99_30410 [Kofleriaceae bacterium]|nr:hypothetical protein [Kofleriaceae bacterium]